MASDRRWGALVTAVLLAGCHHVQSADDALAPCRPVGGRLAERADTREMAGRFAITMVATSGAMSGRAASGSLTLVPEDSALIDAGAAMQPLRGTTDIALDSVGAVRMGDPGANDASAPGVGVYAQRTPGTGALTVVVRLGSGSNSRGPQPFDAGHTTLYVQRITPEGFAGGWASSAGSTFPVRRSQGYFCAVRAPS